MVQYICTMCSFRYNEARGFLKQDIAPGTKWEEFCEGWKCPMCGSPSNIFKVVIDDHIESS